jgi:DNA-binding response OmpR family regulator
MAKLLLIEDDLSLVEELRDVFQREGHTVDTMQDGMSGLDALKSFIYDLIILDVNIPQLNGIDLCHQFRSGGGVTPLLMLTGLSTDTDKERGLDSGADDYLTKPFSSRELLARIRALIRRSPAAPVEQLRIKDLVVETSSKNVKRGDREIKLWAKEYDVLVFLMRNINHIFDADTLLSRVWPMESEVSPEAIRQCIKRLREKIDIEGESSIISTVKGFGYTIKNI